MTLIGIVGFGNLGQAIYEYCKREAHLGIVLVWKKNPKFLMPFSYKKSSDVAWVWNRSFDKLLDLPEDEMLEVLFWIFLKAN